MVKTVNNKFRSHYSPQLRVSFETEGESLTEQQFAEESTVIAKIRKYDSQGFFDTINRNPAQYNDYSAVTDLASAIDKIDEARESFATIPSDIRKQFNNDPSEFFHFASDEKNFDKLVEMGLATKPIPENIVEKTSSTDVEEKVESKDSTASTV